MKVNYSVPFYPNTSDNTHCWQAALKMVLKFYEPKKNYSWKELDRLTEKKGIYGRGHLLVCFGFLSMVIK